MKDYFPKRELVLLATNSGLPLAQTIDKHLVRIRKKQWKKEFLSYPKRKKEKFLKDSYLVKSGNIPFGSGELKSVIEESVEEAQVFVVADIVNPLKYSMRGEPNRSSPQDNFFSALSMANAAKTDSNQVHLVMPYFFSGRQDNIHMRESLDSKLACELIKAAKITSVITLDAHNPSTLLGALGKEGFNELHASYHHIKLFLETRLKLDGSSFSLDEWEIMGPDAGASDRADFYSKQLKGKPSIHGMDKMRDERIIVDGYNNIRSHEYYGPLLKTNILFVDDIGGSNKTFISAASLAKDNGAKTVDVAISHGLNLKGVDSLIKAHEDGLLDQIYMTNSNFVQEDVLALDYVHQADSLEQFAHYLNRMNRGKSRSELLDNKEKIAEFIEKHNIKIHDYN